MTQLDLIYTDVLRRHVSSETVFDMESTLATLTPDCLFEDMAWGESHRGHEGVRNYYNEWWSAFGNVPTRSRSYVVGGDSLIVETHFVGKHVGRYRGIAPTGHDIDLPVAIFVGFRDGLMSGERFYYDRTTLLTQIGAT